MWANLHLLFWLSPVPFVTGWMGETQFQSIPSALYGGVLLMAALAHLILQTLIIRLHGSEFKLGVDRSGREIWSADNKPVATW